MIQLGICSDAATCKVTSDETVWGYQAVDDKTFDAVREVCAATKNEKCAKA
jgi:phosphonate transport system substrate-binding protein